MISVKNFILLWIELFVKFNNIINIYIYYKKFILYFMEIEKTLFRVHEKFLTKEEAPKVLNISVYVSTTMCHNQ